MVILFQLKVTCGKTQRTMRFFLSNLRQKEQGSTVHEDESLDKEDRRGILLRIGSELRQNHFGAPPAAATTTTTNLLPDESAEDSLASIYEDDFNDEPWKCSFGTREGDGVWLNSSDIAGTIMALMVWVLIVRSK